MSRPFSYNDENFTVIGNILFVHFRDEKARRINEPVLEVPYEIFRRLVTISNTVIVSVDDIRYSSTTASISIKMINEKPFIVFRDERTSGGEIKRYHYCIYLLKDI